MNRISKLGWIPILFCLLASCQEIPKKSWTGAIPDKSPFVIIPSENTTLNSVLKSSYIPFLEDITSSAIQLVSKVDTGSTSSLALEAIMLYPGTRDRLQPIWIANAPENYAAQLKKIFREPFTQNEYYFNNIVIQKLQIQNHLFYAAQLHDHLLLSESSLGVEDAIRSYMGWQPSADLADIKPVPSSILMNTPSLDKWVEQLAKIIYRPHIKGSFKGTRPVLLSLSRLETEEYSAQSYSGSLDLKDTSKSVMVAALSEINAPVELDRYISSNAAAFGLFRLKPRLAPPVAVEDATRLDSVLIREKIHYIQLARSLEAPFGIVTYSESGFLSTGEHLYLRKLSDRSAFREQLDKLAGDNLIRKQGNIYFVRSKVLARLIGSDLNTFQDFYLDITEDVAVISKRKGLVEAVASDRSRRRVVYYEENYMTIKEELPEEISGLIVLNPDFKSFISPFLAPENYLDVILSKFNLMSLSTRLDSTDNKLALDITTYNTEQRTQPYEEKWLFPTGGAELTGDPLLADIGGSSREEVIFSTGSGTVYALAADGTVVLQLSTGEDTPVGSPVAYDWYGTNQNVILIAAGNKIYGWNDTGDPLPKFPFELDEPITTPLTVADVDRNGLPDVLVATADREFHVLDGRGNNLNGWPMTTNSVITSKPLVDYFGGTYSILGFSENAVHAWLSDGSVKSGFPKFVNASLSGSPVLFKGNILAGAADGNLYSIGNRQHFTDSLNIFSNTSDSTGISAVYVANSALTGTPSVHEDLTIESESEIYSEPMILTMSSNGSVFLIDQNGKLLFTQSMSQPSARNFSALVADINSDNQKEAVALADFGRLYAWQIRNGGRIYPLPTTGMGPFLIEDIDGDGYRELIAQTRTGLRCWTIFGAQ